MSNFSDDFLKDIERLRELEATSQTPEGQADLNRELSNLDLYNVAATVGTPLDPKYKGQVEDLLHKGDMAGLEAVFGSPEAARQIWDEYSKANAQVRDDLNRTRTAYEAFTDTASQPGRDFVNAIWGLG